MAETRDISFKFGPMQGPIKDRLNEQGFDISVKDSDVFELIRKSINVLAIHGYAMPSSVRKMFTRLAKKISDKATVHKKEVV